MKPKFSYFIPLYLLSLLVATIVKAQTYPPPLLNTYPGYPGGGECASWWGMPLSGCHEINHLSSSYSESYNASGISNIGVINVTGIDNILPVTSCVEGYYTVGYFLRNNMQYTSGGTPGYGGFRRLIITKYDGDLKVSWSRTYDITSIENTYPLNYLPTDIKVLTNGDIVVVGEIEYGAYEFSGPMKHKESFVFRLSSAGTPIWFKETSNNASTFTSGGASRNTAVVEDKANYNIVACGIDNGIPSLTVLNASGTVLDKKMFSVNTTGLANFGLNMLSAYHINDLRYVRNNSGQSDFVAIGSVTSQVSGATQYADDDALLCTFNTNSSGSIAIVDFRISGNQYTGAPTSDQNNEKGITLDVNPDTYEIITANEYNDLYLFGGVTLALLNKPILIKYRFADLLSNSSAAVLFSKRINTHADSPYFNADDYYYPKTVIYANNNASNQSSDHIMLLNASLITPGIGFTPSFKYASLIELDNATGNLTREFHSQAVSTGGYAPVEMVQNHTNTWDVAILGKDYMTNASLGTTYDIKVKSGVDFFCSTWDEYVETSIIDHTLNEKIFDVDTEMDISSLVVDNPLTETSSNETITSTSTCARLILAPKPVGTGCESESFTQVAGVSKDEGIEIFPNPVEGFMNISISEGLYINMITIFNSLGQVVFQEKINGIKKQIKLNLNSFDKGFYYIDVQSGNASYRRTLLKK